MVTFTQKTRIANWLTLTCLHPIINVKMLSNFENEWSTFDPKKGSWKYIYIYIVHYKSLVILNMQKHSWFASNFEHSNFVSNGAYSKNIVFPLWFFQRYKNTILTNVHPFRWLLWLCFQPTYKMKKSSKKSSPFLLDLKSTPNIHKFLWSPFWYLNWFYWCQYLTNVFLNSISKFIPLINLEMGEKKLNFDIIQMLFLKS
jgi:hypothetical protein